MRACASGTPWHRSHCSRSVVRRRHRRVPTRARPIPEIRAPMKARSLVGGPTRSAVTGTSRRSTTACAATRRATPASHAPTPASRPATRTPSGSRVPAARETTQAPSRVILDGVAWPVSAGRGSPTATSVAGGAMCSHERRSTVAALVLTALGCSSSARASRDASSSAPEGGLPTCTNEGEFSCGPPNEICCHGHVFSFADGVCGGPTDAGGAPDGGLTACDVDPHHAGCPCASGEDAGAEACDHQVVMRCNAGVWEATNRSCDGLCTPFP